MEHTVWHLMQLYNFFSF